MRQVRDPNEPRRERSRWPWIAAVAPTGAPILLLWATATAAGAIAEELTRLMVVLRWIGGKVDWASRKRGVAGISGITLVLVPTLFTVFPHWGQWRLLPKFVLLAAWLMGAAIVVARTIRMESEISGLSARQRAVEVRAREKALDKSVDTLLDQIQNRLPTGYHVQIFLPASDRKHLIPARDPSRVGPEEGWRIDLDPPQAVTGAAWKTNDYVFAKGPAVSDAAFGLTPEQQQRYNELTAVAATPIRDPRRNPIGVLTVSTQENDIRVTDREFVELLIASAAELAPVLEDLRASVAPE